MEKVKQIAPETQLILYPPYVLSKGKKALKNLIRGKFRKKPKYAYSFFFSREFGKNFNI